MIVAYEDTRSWGYGAEIAARIAGHPQLEAEILPQVDDLVRESERLLAW